MKNRKNGPKILTLDIETFGYVVETWGIWDQTIQPDQIIKDWCVASWSAKWIDDPPEKIMYMDNRDRKDPRNDEKIIKAMHKLLNEADVIVTQNGKSFDIKKLNARFAFYDLTPTRPYKHFDTKQAAKTKFGFTSNSLKHLCEYLHIKYKKSDHKKFPGRELWRQCEAKNLKAWKEMEKYNKIDVLATEEVYKKLEPWTNTLNLAIFTDLNEVTCNCGSTKFHSRGSAKTKTCIYKRYQCQGCGTWVQGKKIPLTKEQKENLRKKV